MKVDYRGGKFLVSKGRKTRQYFICFVDFDSSCWTRKASISTHFGTEQEALNVMESLRRRAKLRREQKAVPPAAPRDCATSSVEAARNKSNEKGT